LPYRLVLSRARRGEGPLPGRSPGPREAVPIPGLRRHLWPTPSATASVAESPYSKRQPKSSKPFTAGSTAAAPTKRNEDGSSANGSAPAKNAPSAAAASPRQSVVFGRTPPLATTNPNRPGEWCPARENDASAAGGQRGFFSFPFTSPRRRGRLIVRVSQRFG